MFIFLNCDELNNLTSFYLRFILKEKIIILEINIILYLLFYKKDTKSKRRLLNNLEVGPGAMEEKVSSADRSQQCGNALFKVC